MERRRGVAALLDGVRVTGTDQSVSRAFVAQRYRNCSTVPGVWPAWDLVVGSKDDPGEWLLTLSK